MRELYASEFTRFRDQQRTRRWIEGSFMPSCPLLFPYSVTSRNGLIMEIWINDILKSQLLNLSVRRAMRNLFPYINKETNQWMKGMDSLWFRFFLDLQIQFIIPQYYNIIIRIVCGINIIWGIPFCKINFIKFSSSRFCCFDKERVKDWQMVCNKGQIKHESTSDIKDCDGIDEFFSSSSLAKPKEASLQGIVTVTRRKEERALLEHSIMCFLFFKQRPRVKRGPATDRQTDTQSDFNHFRMELQSSAEVEVVDSVGEILCSLGIIIIIIKRRLSLCDKTWNVVDIWQFLSCCRPQHLKFYCGCCCCCWRALVGIFFKMDGWTSNVLRNVNNNERWMEHSCCWGICKEHIWFE